MLDHLLVYIYLCIIVGIIIKQYYTILIKPNLPKYGPFALKKFNKKVNQLEKSIPFFNTTNRIIRYKQGLSLLYDFNHKKIVLIDSQLRYEIYSFTQIENITFSETIGYAPSLNFLEKRKIFSSVEMHIHTYSTQYNRYTVLLFDKGTSKSKHQYKYCVDLYNYWEDLRMNVILYNRDQHRNRQKRSNIDDLSRLKQLLDNGALTPQEFQKEKEKLLL